MKTEHICLHFKIIEIVIGNFRQGLNHNSIHAAIMIPVSWESEGWGVPWRKLGCSPYGGIVVPSSWAGKEQY